MRWPSSTPFLVGDCVAVDFVSGSGAVFESEIGGSVDSLVSSFVSFVSSVVLFTSFSVVLMFAWDISFGLEILLIVI